MPRRPHHSSTSTSNPSRAAAHANVDGVALRTWSTGVPKAPMNLFANAGFPAWLDGLAPPETRAARVEQIRLR